jgi:hypothetical protein
MLPSITSTFGCASVNVALDEGSAELDFVGGGRAVTRRPPGDHVGDVGSVAIEADRRQHAVEQLPRAADKGRALKVFLAPRRLADEHHVRFRIAVGEHQRLGAVAQIAAGKAVKRRAQFGNRAGAGSQRPGVLERRFAGDRQLRRLPRWCDRGRWCPAVDAGTGCRLAARPRLVSP